MERCERAEQVCGSGRWGGEGQAGRETFTDFIFVVFVFFFFLRTFSHDGPPVVSLIVLLLIIILIITKRNRL